MIRQTSILAYHDINAEGVTGVDQRLYLSLLKDLGCPSTDREVAASGNVDVMRMERRRNDLVHLGIIMDVGTRKCGVSKRLCHIWWFV